MVWSGVLLLMLHFVSDFEKVLSHKVHLESTRSPPGVHMESMWSLPGVHLESTKLEFWDCRWTPQGLHEVDFVTWDFFKVRNKMQHEE